MNGTDRGDAPFSGRLWQEIEQVVSGVRTANCTARRFLPIDGPYGAGLTSVGGDDRWLIPDTHGATSDAWSVKSAAASKKAGDPPDRAGAGTYMVRGITRAVPLIASEFDLGMRAVEAFDTGCQPLDFCAAVDAARDVALEEERLIYYGLQDDPVGLLRIQGNSTTVKNGEFDTIPGIYQAIEALARRGYPGPFALAAGPNLYTRIYSPNFGETGPRVELIRDVFRAGIHLVPVIDAATDPNNKDVRRLGAIVTVGRFYCRLVVGQDWVTSYRGRDGVLHRFLIMSSLQLRICDPRSIQVLTGEDAPPPTAGPTVVALSDPSVTAIENAIRRAKGGGEAGASGGSEQRAEGGQAEQGGRPGQRVRGATRAAGGN